MKVKVSELEGAALDWAVAKCVDDGLADFTAAGWRFYPSCNWAQGGPIIEQERIGLTPMTPTVGEDLSPYWFANHENATDFADGPTPLIAAMRCYVASKLGDEVVDIPDELGEQA